MYTQVNRVCRIVPSYHGNKSEARETKSRSLIREAVI